MFNSSSIAEVGKFGLVGIVNTIIDFFIFNLLTSKRFNIGKIPANICSTSAAMIFSFFANREAVFHAGSGDPTKQAITFFITTGFGLYVIQTGALWLLLNRWHWPKRWVVRFLKITGLNKRFSTDFVLKNAAKAGAILASLTWNFLMYKYVVFS